MAGHKRSPNPTATITKYFCSKVASCSGSGISTETETSTPEESESSAAPASSESVTAGDVSSESEFVLDLGHIIKSSMDVADVSGAVSKLTNGQRYKLLKEHYRPRADFKFPKTFSNGCYRSFQIQMA